MSRNRQGSRRRNKSRHKVLNKSESEGIAIEWMKVHGPTKRFGKAQVREKMRKEIPIGTPEVETHWRVMLAETL